MDTPGVTIHDTNVSYAWVRALAALTNPGITELVPLVVSTNIVDGNSAFDIRIQDQLDEFLSAFDKTHSCNTTANTIFPQQLWNPSADRHQLFDRYDRVLPRLKRCKPNRYGLYFARMTDYGDNHKNQLDHIISTYEKGNHRTSALQLSIFDPNHDHTDQPLRGFPCLQHVNFIPINDKQMAVIGMYATQYMVDRGYGNYLGLYRLGTFVAHELDLQLTRVTCIAAKAELGKPSKGKTQVFMQKLCEILPDEVINNMKRDKQAICGDRR